MGRSLRPLVIRWTFAKIKVGPPEKMRARAGMPEASMRIGGSMGKFG